MCASYYINGKARNRQLFKQAAKTRRFFMLLRRKIKETAALFQGFRVAAGA
jgi:hypothetical protein